MDQFNLFFFFFGPTGVWTQGRALRLLLLEPCPQPQFNILSVDFRSSMYTHSVAQTALTTIQLQNVSSSNLNIFFVYSYVHTMIGSLFHLSLHSLPLPANPLASKQKLFCPYL
jgi:hypothetical protein